MADGRGRRNRRLPPRFRLRGTLFSLLPRQHFIMGGALGSALGAYGWTHWGWNGLCAAGAVQLLMALGVRGRMRFRAVNEEASFV